MSRAETSCFSNQDIAFVNIDVSVGINSISLLHKIHLCSWDYKLLLIFSMNLKIIMGVLFWHFIHDMPCNILPM